MSKFSNLFTAGIFFVFLAVLFHYFCRVRKKPDMIVQQQVQVQPPADGYVYPITPNNQQTIMGPNYSIMDQRFVISSNVPYPMNMPSNAYPYPYPYTTTSTGSDAGGQSFNAAQQNASQQVPRFMPYPQPQFPMVHQGHQQYPDDDLPPPYHTVVGNSAQHPH